MCVQRNQLPSLAMLNYGIIEWDACVTISVCLVTVATVLVAPDQSHQLRKLLQELLLEILTKGLTTMTLPCTICTGHYRYKLLLSYCQLALRAVKC